MRLDELRSNPDKNVRVPGLETLLKYKGRPDVFVSFTSDVGAASHVQKKNQVVTVGDQNYAITVQGGAWSFLNYNATPKDRQEKYEVETKISALIGKKPDRNVSGAKIGLNPKSKYGTPLGIYTYPVDYVIKTSVNAGKIGAEFTGDAEWRYLWIVQATVHNDARFDCQNFSNADLTKVRENLTMMMEKQGFSESTIKDLLDGAAETPKIDTIAAKAWNMARLVSERLAENKTNANARSVQWSAVMRTMGFDYAIDLGSGLIHENEPTQAVFFNPNAFTCLDMVQPSGQFEKAINRFAYRSLDNESLVSQHPYVYYQIANAQVSAHPVGDTFDEAWEKAIVQKLKGTPYYDLLLDRALSRANIHLAKTMAGGTLTHEQQMLVSQNDSDGLALLVDAGFPLNDELVLAAFSRFGNQTKRFLEAEGYKIKESSLIRFMRSEAIKGRENTIASMVEVTDITPEMLIEVTRRFPQYIMPRLAHVLPLKTVYTVLRRNPKLLHVVGEATIKKLPDSAVRSFLADNPWSITNFRHAGPDIQIYALKMAIKKNAMMTILNYIKNPHAETLRWAFEADPETTIYSEHTNKLLSAVGEDRIVAAIRKMPILVTYFNLPTDTMVEVAIKGGIQASAFPASVQFTPRLVALFLENDIANYPSLVGAGRKGISFADVPPDLMAKTIEAFPASFVKAMGRDAKLDEDTFFTLLLDRWRSLEYFDIERLTKHFETNKGLADRFLKWVGTSDPEVVAGLAYSRMIGPFLSFEARLMACKLAPSTFDSIYSHVPKADQERFVDYVLKNAPDILVRSNEFWPKVDEKIILRVFAKDQFSERSLFKVSRALLQQHFPAILKAHPQAYPTLRQRINLTPEAVKAADPELYAQLEKTGVFGIATDDVQQSG